jgi:hypothetical protein
VGGVEGGAFSLAGWECLKDMGDGQYTVVKVEIYILYYKWLPEGKVIVKNWGEWRGGVY